MLHLLSSISSLIYLYLSSLSISHFSLDFFHPRRVFTHSLTHTQEHTQALPTAAATTQKGTTSCKGREGRRHEEKCVACFWELAPTLSLDMASISGSRNRRPKSATASLLFFYLFFFAVVVHKFWHNFWCMSKAEPKKDKWGGVGEGRRDWRHSWAKDERQTDWQRERERGRKEAKNRFKNANSSAWPG